MANRAAVFIDGGYLTRVLRDEFGQARIDYGKLSKRLAGGSDILRTYYYDCPAYQSDPVTPEESRRYSSQQTFFNRLERLPRYTVRLGQLERRFDEQGNVQFQQKRVDILLGVDMIQLAAKHVIQDAVLVAGDSDFIPAVIAAKSEGVVVKLLHGERPASDLWREADERTRITQEIINSVLRNPHT